MSRAIIAEINRHEELLLELVADRFAARWKEATSPEGVDDERAEFFRGWSAAWDEAQQALLDIIAGHEEGNDVKMDRWTR